MNRLSLSPLTAAALISMAGLSSLWVAPARAAVMLDEHDRIPTMVVSGTGEVQRKPDFAVVSVGFEIQTETAKEASDQAGKAIEAIGKAVRGIGITGELVLQTGNVDLSPVYSEPPVGSTGRLEHEPKLIGFRASTTVQVRTPDPRSVGKVIDAAISAGANKVFGVSFGLKELAEARQEAIKLAAKAAKAKARTLAESLEITLGGVLDTSIGEPRRGFGANQFSNRGVVEQAPAFSDAIEPGLVSVTAEVSITYRLANESR